MDKYLLQKIFFAGILAVIIFFSYLIFAPYLGVLILSATLAIIFRPIYRGTLAVLHYESLAACVTIALVTIVIFIPLVFFSINIVSEATGLYGTLSAHGGFDFDPAIQRFFTTHFPRFNTPDFALNFNDSARAALTWLIRNLGSVSSGVAQVLFVAFLNLLGLFYFLKDGARLKVWMLNFIPLTPVYTEQIIHETETVMMSVVMGTLAMAVIQGVVVGVGFLLFGIPNAAFWGGLTIFVTLIPIIGTWLVVIPAVGYLFFISQNTAGLALAVWCIILVNLVYNVLAPQLMNRGAHIHPFIILLSVIGGIGAFGPIGFLMGPFITALLFALLRVYPKLVGK